MTTRHFDKAYRDALHVAGTRYAKLAEGVRDLSLVLEEFRTIIDKGKLRTLMKILNVIQMEIIRRGLSTKEAEQAFTTRLFGALEDIGEEDAGRGPTGQEENPLGAERKGR